MKMTLNNLTPQQAKVLELLNQAERYVAKADAAKAAGNETSRLEYVALAEAAMAGAQLLHDAR